jgi:hypothetical protein
LVIINNQPLIRRDYEVSQKTKSEISQVGVARAAGAKPKRAQYKQNWFLRTALERKTDDALEGSGMCLEEL